MNRLSHLFQSLFRRRRLEDGVIWMLGWCMILMGLLVRLPIGVNAAFGLVMIAGHNLLPLMISGSQQQYIQQGSWGGFGGFSTSAEPRSRICSCSIDRPLGWLMAAGYAFGAVLRMDPQAYARMLLDGRCSPRCISAIAIFQCVR